MMVQYKQRFVNKSIYMSKLKLNIRSISISITGSLSVCSRVFFSQYKAAKSTEVEQSSQGFWATKEEGQPDPHHIYLPAQQMHVELIHSRLFLNHLAAYLAISSFRQPALGQQHEHLHYFSKEPRFPRQTRKQLRQYFSLEKKDLFIYFLFLP